MSSETKGTDAVETVEAWHFLTTDRTLAHTSPPVPVIAGETYSATGTLELCTTGMHASIRALDALNYAPGPVICRVELSGDILHGDDKLCARNRRVLWMADATDTLHEFGCWAAEQALTREREAGREPDTRCWNAIEAKWAWLRGEITDAQLDAAWDAALDVALDAAGTAAWADASVAVRAAVRVAVSAAVWSTQNTRLTEMLWALAPVATGA